VIGLATGEAERPLLQYRVAPVPQRERQAQPLLDVAEPGKPVLTPPIGARACVIMREIAPGVTVGAVVLADCAPRSFSEVGPQRYQSLACRRQRSS
jgi:hypothetical protein